MENKQISMDHREPSVPVILSAETFRFLEYIVKMLEFFWGKCHVFDMSHKSTI